MMPKSSDKLILMAFFALEINFTKFTKDKTDYWNVGDMVLFMTIPESHGLILDKEILETIEYIVYFPIRNTYRVLYYHNIKYIDDESIQDGIIKTNFYKKEDIPYDYMKKFIDEIKTN